MSVAISAQVLASPPPSHPPLALAMPNMAKCFACASAGKRRCECKGRAPYAWKRKAEGGEEEKEKKVAKGEKHEVADKEEEKLVKNAEDEKSVKGERGGEEEKEQKVVKGEKHEVADKEEEKLVKKDFGALLAHYYERKKFWASEVDGLAVWWFGVLVGWWAGGLVG